MDGHIEFTPLRPPGYRLLRGHCPKEGKFGTAEGERIGKGSSLEPFVTQVLYDQKFISKKSISLGGK